MEQGQPDNGARIGIKKRLKYPNDTFGEEGRRGSEKKKEKNKNTLSIG